MRTATLPRRRPDPGSYRLGTFAGLAGGLAEIGWIVLYSSFGAADTAAVARGVTHTFSPEPAAVSASVAVGIAIHMTLALMLGVAVAVAVAAKLVLPRSGSALLEACFVMAVLIAVWAVNFHVLLPLINPAFAELIPLGASLASKITFGVAAAMVLQFGNGCRRHSGTITNEIMP